MALAALGLGAAALTGACCGAGGAGRGDQSRGTVVIIGMRGAGKSTLGRGAADALGLPFEDLDDTLEESVGLTCREFVAAHGWEAFRAKEREVLAAALAPRPAAHAGRVLACGGGVVESAAAMQLLSEWRGGVVVWIDRPIDAIVAAFGGPTGRPWGTMDEQKLREMFARRKPLYELACDEVFTVPGSSSAAEATAALSAWLPTRTQ
eukprot:COSAG06_NODE_1431_length_9481_cov_15.565611_7_plen_207_part_00